MHLDVDRLGDEDMRKDMDEDDILGEEFLPIYVHPQPLITPKHIIFFVIALSLIATCILIGFHK